MWNQYADIAETLAETGSPCQLSELHGFFVGVMCAGKSAISAEVLEEIFVTDSVKHSFLLRLSQFIEQIQADLDDDALQFAPLLPEESEGLGAIAVALGEWCRGFVYGFGLSQDVPQALSEETETLLADMIAVSQIDADISDTDASEQDLMELVEYVRVAVMDLYFDRSVQPVSR
jgi:yecA family protein